MMRKTIANCLSVNNFGSNLKYNAVNALLSAPLNRHCINNVASFKLYFQDTQDGDAKLRRIIVETILVSMVDALMTDYQMYITATAMMVNRISIVCPCWYNFESQKRAKVAHWTNSVGVILVTLKNMLFCFLKSLLCFSTRGLSSKPTITIFLFYQTNVKGHMLIFLIIFFSFTIFHFLEL